MKKKIIAILASFCIVFCAFFCVDVEKVEAAPTGTMNVLCIGNSITQFNPIPNMWWGNWGCAATTVNTDYAHLLQSYLSQRYKNVSVTPVYFAPWEKDVMNRAAYCPALDGLLALHPNVIVIELGENCAWLGNFAYDYLYLINYCMWKDPGCKIILVGTITTTWCDPSVEYYKQYVYNLCKYAGYKNVSYVDTSPVYNNPAYWAWIGEPVAGLDGQWHTITDISIALHPNDWCMQYLATEINKKI